MIYCLNEQSYNRTPLASALFIPALKDGAFRAFW